MIPSAIECTKLAIGILGENDPRVEGTLASAFAENGDLEEVVKWQTK